MCARLSLPMLREKCRSLSASGEASGVITASGVMVLIIACFGKSFCVHSEKVGSEKSCSNYVIFLSYLRVMLVLTSPRMNLRRNRKICSALI